jgi:hypothetical protein
MDEAAGARFVAARVAVGAEKRACPATVRRGVESEEWDGIFATQRALRLACGQRRKDEYAGDGRRETSGRQRSRLELPPVRTHSHTPPRHDVAEVQLPDREPEARRRQPLGDGQCASVPTFARLVAADRRAGPTPSDQRLGVSARGERRPHPRARGDPHHPRSRPSTGSCR